VRSPRATIRLIPLPCRRSSGMFGRGPATAVTRPSRVTNSAFESAGAPHHNLTNATAFPHATFTPAERVSVSMPAEGWTDELTTAGDPRPADRDYRPGGGCRPRDGVGRE